MSLLNATICRRRYLQALMMVMGWTLSYAPSHAIGLEPSPSPSTRRAINRHDDAQLRSARQALAIARDDCLSRLRQTAEYAQMQQRLELSQQNRLRAKESGTVQQQMDAEEAHLKSLLALRDLMVSTVNTDPAVAKASAELATVERQSAATTKAITEQTEQ